MAGFQVPVVGSGLTGRGGVAAAGLAAGTAPVGTAAGQLLDQAIRLSGGDLRSAREALASAIHLLTRSPRCPDARPVPVPGPSGRVMPDPPGLQVSDASRPPAIRIQTLGKFELTVNDRPMLFPARLPRRPLAVLKWLAAESRRGVSVTVAAQGLWPDADDDRGGNALNVAVHRLRRLLHSADAVVYRHGALHLAPTVVDVDLWRFEDRFDQAQRDKAHGRMTEFEAAGLHALSLVTGIFLPGEEPWPWVLAARHRIARMTVQLASALSSHLVGRGRMEQAESVCEAGLGVDPLSECLYQRLMEIQLGQERRAEVARTFARCRQLLHARLGTAPSAASVALYQQALASRRPVSSPG